MKRNKILILTILFTMIFTIGVGAETYTIKWKPFSGSLNYTYENTLDFKMDISPQETMDWQLIQTMVMEQEMQQNDEGNISTLVTITDYNQDIKGMALQEQEKEELEKASQAIVGKVFQMKLTPQGKILEINMPEGFDSMGNAFNYNIAAYFPEEPLAIGDSWEHDEKVRLPLENNLGDLPMEMNFKYRLIGTQEIDGYQCLVISVNGDMQMEFSSPLGEGQKMDMDMQMDLGGYYYFAPEKGILIKSIVEGKMVGLMGIPVPTNQEQTEFTNQQFKMEMNIKGTMDLN
ncbi:MAG: hypothetical protein UMV23_01705 [Halanaerobium sp.]|nr:hypothetical protein [Halanaerobium sp.]